MTSSTRATRVHNRVRGHNPPSRFRSVTFAEADRFRKTVLPGAVRKNYLFAGSDAGGRRAAAMYSLIESAKLNGLNPQHYLTDLLARIADHPARRIAELLPWNWQPADTARAAA